MRVRRRALGLVVLALSLSGCSAAPAAEEAVAEAPESSAPSVTRTASAPSTAASAAPTAASGPSAAAEATPSAAEGSSVPVRPSSPAASPSRTVATVAWTDASLWATCQQEWGRQHAGISWAGWERFRSADASTTSDGLHHVARFRKDDDGGVLEDRDCIIGGTRTVPSVFLDPPLDGFDRSKMPTPSTTFALP